MPTTSWSDDSVRLLALFLVQFVGGLIGLMCATYIEDFTNLKIRNRLTWCIALLLIVTLVLLVATPDFGGKMLMRWFEFQWTRPTAETAIGVVGVLDLLALAFFISWTGGPKHSAYLPFLLVIAPLAALFHDNGFWILTDIALTILLFWITLSFHNGHNLKIIQKRMADCWLGAITTTCVVFPVAPIYRERITGMGPMMWLYLCVMVLFPLLFGLIVRIRCREKV